MGKVIRIYDDGRRAMAKTCRSDKTCADCGEIIPKGENLVAIQVEVSNDYRHYFQDEKWFHAGCEIELGDPEKELEELMLKVDNLLRENGYFTGPCCTGANLMTAKNGSPYWEIGISISAILDGTISVFLGKFYANWQRGRYTRSASFDTYQELEKWIKNNGWA